MTTMSVRRWCLALPLSLSILCAAAARAVAAEPEANMKESEAAFKRGLECGDAPCACVNFKHSLLLNPARPSVWVRVALCRLQEKDNAGAWRALLKARELNRASDSFRADLEPVIKEQIDKIPTLTIEIVEPPPGLELYLDGGRLQEAPGEAVGVWSGVHQLSVEAPGYRTERTSVVVDELRERVQISLVAVPKPAPAISPPLSAASVSSPITGDRGSDSVAPRDGSTQRTVGYVLGGAGLVGLGIGAVFGLKALRLQSDAEPFCDENDSCEPAGYRLNQRANNAETVGIVASVAGGLALGGGLVLLLTAAEDTKAEAAQAPPRLDLVLTGTAIQARARW